MTEPDPPTEPRRPLFSAGVFVMLGFCLLCILGGYLFARFGPQFFPVRAPARPEVAEPAPRPTVSIQRLAGPITQPTGEEAVLQAAGAALAAAALSEASLRSGPFLAELQVAARALPGSGEVQALAPLAAVGAPSRMALAAEFASLVRPLTIAAEQPAPNAGAVAQVAHALSSVVLVRRIEADAQGRLPPVSAIERMVDAGDLEAALAAIAQLPAPARERISSWRLRAERRVAIDQHVAAVRTVALARLRPPAAPPPAAVTPPVILAPPAGAPPAANSADPAEPPVPSAPEVANSAAAL